MNLAETVEDFISGCRTRGLSTHTVRAYRQDLQAFQVWVAAAQPDPVLGRDAVTAWLSAMRSEGYAPSTIKRRIACLKVLCRWLEDEERLADNPFHGLRVTVRLPHRLPRNLTRGEITALLAEAGRTDPDSDGGNTVGETTSGPIAARTLSLALELLFTTGIRVGELCGIRLKDIDLDAGTIGIRGKGNRERRVFLVDETIAAQLADYIRRRRPARPEIDTLLLTPRGIAADPNHIRRLLHRHVKRLGLGRRITPHMLRHTAATELLNSGVDIRLVQKLLGHASISTTEIYTHVSDTALQNTLRSLNPRARLRRPADGG